MGQVLLPRWHRLSPARAVPCTCPPCPLEQSWGHPRAQARGAPHTPHTQEVPLGPPGRGFCGIYPNTGEKPAALRGGTRLKRNSRC